MDFDSTTVAMKLGAPLTAVDNSWPLIVAALKEFGIDSLFVQIAAAATVGVETGRSFRPIKEKHADPMRQPALWKLQERYYPSGFYGRGFVQITWRENYKRMGERLGLDLVSNPNLALEPRTSARLLALFFRENGVDQAANKQDWRRVRRIVNGGYTSWEEFYRYVSALLPEVPGV